MRRLFAFVVMSVMAVACATTTPTTSSEATCDASDFVRVDGANLVTPDGEVLFIRGTNLGNWLNPEGYMFGFQKVNSVHFIDEMLRQAVGPYATDVFWANFKNNYITEADIAFIASTGANTIHV